MVLLLMLGSRKDQKDQEENLFPESFSSQDGDSTTQLLLDGVVCRYMLIYANGSCVPSSWL